MYAVRMIGAANGLTTAVNDTVTGTSRKSQLTGTTILVNVGTAAGLFMRFGGPSDTVTVVNGFHLPPDFTGLFSVPSYATHLHYIEEAAVDTTISIAMADGGI